MHPRPLPTHLAARPFRTVDAEVSPRRLRAADLDKSVHGVRLASTGPLDQRTRCRMLALRLTDAAFFTHTTAALLLGAPLPLTVEKDDRLHVAVPAPASAPPARGLRGHSLTLGPGDIVTSSGIRHTSAARTWCDLAGVLVLDDLVAVGDFFINRSMPMTTRDELQRRVERGRGVRGIASARAAIALLSEECESRPESLLRLILMRAGLPQPQINHTLVDTETGRTVRPDLRFPDARLVVEYQGDYHRSRAQWRKDMTRRSRLEARGEYVLEVNADDLRDPNELANRIRLVLTRRG